MHVLSVINTLTAIITMQHQVTYNIKIEEIYYSTEIQRIFVEVWNDFIESLTEEDKNRYSCHEIEELFLAYLCS